MGNLRSAIDEAAAVDPQLLSDAALADWVRELQRAENRIAAIKSTALAIFDRREAFRRQGSRSAQVWVEDNLRVGRGDAKGQLTTAAKLDELAQTSSAFADGRIGQRHAQVIARELDDSVLRSVPGAEAQLVDAAERHAPDAVCRLARYLKIQADQHQAARDDDAKYRSRRLQVRPRGDGMVVIEGLLDPLGGEQVLTTLDCLVRPEPGDLPAEERRTREQRLADALVELARRQADSGALPIKNGQGATVLVRVDLDTLAGQPGARPAELVWTGPVSTQLALRAACSGGVARVVINSESRLIDLGRTTDTASKDQRLALIARDAGCRRCGAPPVWCEAHHIVWYARGGPTDLANLMLLCRGCHQRVHEGGWSIRPQPDGSAVFTAPDGHCLVRPPP